MRLYKTTSLYLLLLCFGTCNIIFCQGQEIDVEDPQAHRQANFNQNNGFQQNNGFNQNNVFNPNNAFNQNKELKQPPQHVNARQAIDNGGLPAQNFEATVRPQDPLQVQSRVGANNKDVGLRQKVLKAAASKLKNAPGLQLSSSDECREDVARICAGRRIQNDIDVLTCLNDRDEQDRELSDVCHHHIWQYKMNVTQNPKFEIIARQVCKSALAQHEDCQSEKAGSGKLLSCLIEHRQEITIPTCTTFLNKISGMLFGDYRLICNFVDDCRDDIMKYSCGKAGSVGTGEQNEERHSQGQVVACLEQQFTANQILQPKCQKQLLRLAELSADDYNLDRNLYFKCRDDRERFCDKEMAGQGRIYKCLFNHKSAPTMSQGCKDALAVRQKLVAKDYKTSHVLVQGCSVEIKKYQCGQTRSQAQGQHEMVGLSVILLCLENAKMSQAVISPSCEEELVDFRRMMMEDYELSPEITTSCAAEIQSRCGNALVKEGETLHCLMGMAHVFSNEDDPEPASFLGAQCEAALKNLIKESEVVSDYKMDAVLMEACQPVVSKACADFKEGDPIILSCLMDQLNTKKMTKMCEKRLVELQYFISRDFNLDPNFRKQCHADAERLCYHKALAGAGNGEGDDESEENQENEMPLGLVLSCLHRHVDESGKQVILSKGCEDEVHRVLKERALNFHLNPDLEKLCRRELGRFCSNEMAEDGQELTCLQDNYEKLTDHKCKEEIRSLTQLESQEAGNLEDALIEACDQMLHEHCKAYLDADDEGEVLQCLIRKKHDMDNKRCVAGIEHFQLIEMKDYRFSYAFLKACKRDVEKNCQTQSAAKTKADVVMCLSEKVRNAVLMSKEHIISKECRKQLTVENLQMHENIQLNPDVQKACSDDYAQYCSDVQPGKARGIECLREHRHELTPKCERKVFNLEEEEAKNPNLDFKLLRTCKQDVKQFCLNQIETGKLDHLLKCLIKHKSKLSNPCKAIVFKREKVALEDIELNPELTDVCSKNINSYCESEVAQAKEAHDSGTDPHGIIYSCLKQHMRSSKKPLTKTCYEHMRDVVEEEGKDYRLDAQLVLHCHKSIDKLCKNAIEDPEQVVECLKEAFINNNLKDTPACQVEISALISLGRSDIKADPVLYEACAEDLERHCFDIPHGGGRQISCLMRLAQNRGENGLISDCREELENRRSMWQNDDVKSMYGLAAKVTGSSNSGYLFSMLTLMCVGVLFLGAACGRLTKRVARERKMR